ncbi:hypothetical protein V757_07925 [Pelistega indica]|uniref:Lipoprotein n=1 Tax=Pelistega indica TaxID=1414851 RepID=V8G2V9_9BURK|nr:MULTISPECIES: hypothetical protein [Pelistega]ETD70426.1 hypothetical protein V757_07925 [Pelistega indica]
MKLSRKLAVAVLPLAVILAGCSTVKDAANATANTVSNAAGAVADAVTPAKQASIDVFLASQKAVKGYQAVKITDKQTIYVNTTKPIITRNQLTALESVKDNQGRSFVRLALNKDGLAALKATPKGQNYVTTVDGQLAAVGAFAQENYLYVPVRDEKVATSIVDAVAGRTTTSK